MDQKQKTDRKKYRDSFIVHTLLGLCGVAVAVYVYKYTDLLSGGAQGYVYVCALDLRELFLRYYGELRYLILLFAAGFTIYAAPAAIIFALLRGFVCGTGILRLAQAARLGELSRLHFVMTALSMALVFGLELVMAAKSARQSQRLKYIVPGVVELLYDRGTRGYLASFAMLCGLLFAAVAMVYFAPLLPI